MHRKGLLTDPEGSSQAPLATEPRRCTDIRLLCLRNLFPRTCRRVIWRFQALLPGSLATAVVSLPPSTPHALFRPPCRELLCVFLPLLPAPPPPTFRDVSAVSAVKSVGVAQVNAQRHAVQPKRLAQAVGHKGHVRSRRLGGARAQEYKCRGACVDLSRILEVGVSRPRHLTDALDVGDPPANKTPSASFLSS